VEGFVYQTNLNVEVWFKPLADDQWAVCFLNRGTTPQRITFDWKKEAVNDEEVSKRDAHFDSVTYTAHNVWTGADAGTTTDALSAEVPGHDVLLLRLSKK